MGQDSNQTNTESEPRKPEDYFVLADRANDAPVEPRSSSSSSSRWPEPSQARTVLPVVLLVLFFLTLCAGQWSLQVDPDAEVLSAGELEAQVAAIQARKELMQSGLIVIGTLLGATTVLASVERRQPEPFDRRRSS